MDVGDAIADIAAFNAGVRDQAYANYRSSVEAEMTTWAMAEGLTAYPMDVSDAIADLTAFNNAVDAAYYADHVADATTAGTPTIHIQSACTGVHYTFIYCVIEGGGAS